MIEATSLASFHTVSEKTTQLIGIILFHCGFSLLRGHPNVSISALDAVEMHTAMNFKADPDLTQGLFAYMRRPEKFRDGVIKDAANLIPRFQMNQQRMVSLSHSRL
jgi:hypothetical protein